MITLTTKTIGRLFQKRISLTPDRPAIGWVENSEVKHLTFNQYKDIINTLTAALNKSGVQVGDKFGILAQTSKEWHLIDMAALLARAVVIPVYHTYTGKEASFILNHSECSTLVVENDRQMEKIISHLSELPHLKNIIALNDFSEETIKKFRNKWNYLTYKELIKLGNEEIKNNPDLINNLIEGQSPDDMASIVYTSGTTGDPKGAVITQHGLTMMLLNVQKSTYGAFTPEDRTLTFLPLSHVLGRADSFFPLLFGWEGVYAESIDKLVDNISLVKPTIMIAVPRIFEKIYGKIMEQVEDGSFAKKKAFEWATYAAKKYFDKIDRDLSPTTTEILEYKLAYKIVFSKIYERFGGHVRFFVSGGAPLAPEIITFLRYAGLTVLEGYGLTETIAPCCLNPLSKQVAGTVGRPIGDVEFKFAADGEILIKSEALFKEYYKNPQATQEAFQDGWFASGDIGTFTTEGYLKITDRKKDLIITSGGKNVAPQKIENIAKTKRSISQMVVLGDKQKYLVALIGIEKEPFLPFFDQWGLSSDCSIKQLSEHPEVIKMVQKDIDAVNAELSSFESIKKFKILPEEFQMENFLTPSLKIKRKVVVQHFAKEIEAMYQE